MSSDIIQYASIAGELAPNMFARTDFKKYDGAWAEAKNWLVDYRGGLFTRAGFEFGDLVERADGEDIRFFEFQFSPDTANTYVILFTNDKIRFIQDNAYVIEAATSVTSLSNDSGNRVLFTHSVAHGYSNGDWIKMDSYATNTTFNTRTAQVANSTATAYNLINPITGGYLEAASVTTETGSSYRIYTVTSPYGEEELYELRGIQISDTLRLTHPDYPIKNLVRSGSTSWAISNETVQGGSLGAPANLSSDGRSANNSNSYCVQVTSVDANGNESAPSEPLVIDGGADITFASSAWERWSWDEVDGAVYYNLYRSRVIDTTSNLLTDSTMGYIGRATGIGFTDNGITPDFTIQAPLEKNPFGNGVIQYVNLDTAGSGYDFANLATVTWPAGGSGASGYLIVANNGTSQVYGVEVISGGSGYTGTSVSESGTGTGFAGTAVLSAASGNNPYCSTIFQQRMVYGGSDENPLQLNGSRVGTYSNFNSSRVGSDSDAYQFNIDSPTVAPIRHLHPVRGGLLVFTQIGMWLVSGLNNAPLTGNNANSDPQSAVGSSIVPPVNLDSYVLYISDAGQEIRMLAYDDYSKLYGGQNVSLLSNHLFDSEIEVNSLTYAPTPSKTVYATQINGRLISMTIDNENSVYAATPNWTKGRFLKCISIEESKESRLYVATERLIGTDRVTFFERQRKRDHFNILENSFCVDAGLELAMTKPAARLTMDTATGSVTFTASASVFAVGDVGKIIRCGSGKATIDSYTSGTSVDGTWTRDLEETYPESTDPAEFLEGDWTMDATTSSVTGLWHLEGETIDVLSDGEVLSKTVTNTAFSLTTAASRVVAGFGYDCIAKSLPISVQDTVVEGRRKSIAGIGVRVYKTLGLKVGATTAKLYEIANRARNLWTTDDALDTEITYEPVRTDWSRDNQIYFVQDTPRPAAILGFIRDTELGDDKE